LSQLAVPSLLRLTGRRALPGPLALAAIALVGLLAGCAPAPVTLSKPAPAEGSTAPATVPTAAAAPSQPAGPTRTVRVALQGVTSDAGVLVGLELGYYREQGIEIEALYVRALPDMLPMLIAGQVEAAGVGINAGTLNAAGRQAFKLVADKGSLTPGHGYLAWVVRQELADSGRFRRDTDLRGLRFGITPPVEATQSMVALQRLLDSLGLRPSDVELQAMPFGDMPAALTGGAIDTAFLSEPFVTAGEQHGILMRWRGVDTIYPNLPLGLMAFSTRFLEEQPDTARRFLVAYLRSVRRYLDAMDYGRDREAVVAALTRHTEVKDPALYERMVPAGLNPDGRIDLAALAGSVEVYRANGALAEMLDLNAIVDHRYVDYALERLGPYRGP